MCGNFFKSGIGSLIAKALPIAAAFIPGIGPLASAALTAGAGAVGSRLQGNGWGDALKSGAISGLASAAMPVMGNAFSQFAPETAASLGIAGGSPTVLSALGLTGSMAGPSAEQVAMNSISNGSSGLAQGSMSSPSFSDIIHTPIEPGGANEMVSSKLAGMDPSLVSSGSSPSGSILGKAAQWAMNNPIPLALGAATAYSGVKQREDQQKQQQDNKDEINNKNAQDLANWKLTLKTPPLPRTANPEMSNIDYNNYGYGPERKFFDNNQISPSNYMAEGGHVRNRTDGEPDMMPMDNLRNKISKKKVPLSDGEPDMVPNLSSVSPQNSSAIKRRLSNMKYDGEPDMMPPGYKKGGKFPKKNGKISGPGGPTGDEIPAMLSNGEYVIKNKTVTRIGGGNNKKGAKILDTINNGSTKKLSNLGKKVKKLGSR